MAWLTKLLKGTSDFGGAQHVPLPMSAIQPMGRTDIAGIAPSSFWFSALQPVKPVSPPGFRPRQWPFQPGANIIWQPKGEDSAIDYPILRAVADSLDLLRIAIEQQKDRLCSEQFEIRAVQQPGESLKDRKQRNAKDPQVQALKKFWEYPDGTNSFKQWLRMWLEDMIVIDAVALWLARDDQGKVMTVHPLAGDFINRMLTEQGLTPPPGTGVANQQVLYGYPVWDFDSADLLFFMRNQRTNKRYGYSPVEQIIRTITLGIRRLTWQLSEYTAGNIPEALVFLDNDLTIDRVKEIQDWWDSIMAGDLERRRQVRFFPGTGTPGEKTNPNIVFPKAPLLKDELDVWLAQVICYCIGVSVQPFMKMLNRASAEQAQELSEEEGKKPYVDAIITVLNDLTQRKMGFVGYEWVAQQQQELDVLRAAQSDNLLVGKVFTINEVRERRGEDPRAEPEADQLGMFSPMNGFIPLGTQPENAGPTNPDGSPAAPKNGKQPPKPTAGAGEKSGAAGGASEKGGKSGKEQAA